MRFNPADLTPNQPIAWAAVRVGNTSDARWRNVPKSTKSIDSIAARKDDRRQQREARR